MSDNKTSGSRGKGRPRAFDRATALNKALEVFWQYGYEPASVALLCKAMQINPPSLYAAFGTKADLFLEAVMHYEHTYWDEPARRFRDEPDIYRGVADFFETSARILLSPDSPCGCMVVLAAVNIAESETVIIERVRALREATRQMFADRLEQARADGQIPEDSDIRSLATALNTFLEGLSLQVRDGLSLDELLGAARRAICLLPPRT